MKIHELSPAPGSTRPAWRKGRGIGSGNGKTAGRGHKGQWARSGGGVRPGFEGGQTPMYRRLPKRGFTNARFRTDYTVVNVSELDRFDDNATITLDTLLECGVVSQSKGRLKVLGRGDISKKLTVQAAIFSASAKEKIEAIGGKAEVV